MNNQKSENDQSNNKTLETIGWTLMFISMAIMLYYIFILKPQYNEAVIQTCKTTIHNIPNWTTNLTN